MLSIRVVAGRSGFLVARLPAVLSSLDVGAMALVATLDEKPVPVIVAFHGGGTPVGPGGLRAGAGLAVYIDLDEKATRAGFAVVYPEGYQHSWNAGPGPDGKSPNWGPAFAQNVDDVKFVKALLEDLASILPIDRRRIYATGMSNGAAISYRLAIEMSEHIAAVAGVVSEVSLVDPAPPPRRVPIMHFWGTADTIQRAGSPKAAERTARHIATWRRLNGWTEAKDVSRKGSATCEVFKPGDSGPSAPVILWTVEGMGHCWPGARGGLRLNQFLGPPNLDISASDEIVAFFLAHQLTPAGSGR
jgi:polyhydroxybutyrate depolymerase